MKHKKIILAIGIVELLIGGVTLLTTLGSLFLSYNQKPLNVLIFVLATSIISSSLGIGIIKSKKIAYQLLLYFSSVVLLNKVLLFAGIIHLNGKLATFLPASLINLTSVLYHLFIIWYLCKKDVRKIFLN
ncbi:MAG: hypothetical protein WC552_08365 [Candidatus Omnitrophota bacterium]